MEKYNVADIVETKYGVGLIVDIWELNEMVTVFTTRILTDESTANIMDLYYGDLIRVLDDEDYEGVLF